MTLSRAEFDKISSIEGIHMSSELSKLIQKMLDDSLNHDDSRKKLMEHFKTKATCNK